MTYTSTEAAAEIFKRTGRRPTLKALQWHHRNNGHGTKRAGRLFWSNEDIEAVSARILHGRGRYPRSHT